MICKTNWNKLKQLSDKEINKAISEDPDTYSPTNRELRQFKRSSASSLPTGGIIQQALLNTQKNSKPN